MFIGHSTLIIIPIPYQQSCFKNERRIIIENNLLNECNEDIVKILHWQNDMRFKEYKYVFDELINTEKGFCNLINNYDEEMIKYSLQNAIDNHNNAYSYGHQITIKMM